MWMRIVTSGALLVAFGVIGTLAATMLTPEQASSADYWVTVVYTTLSALTGGLAVFLENLRKGRSRR